MATAATPLYTETQFNLWGVIREVLDEINEADPQVAVFEVMKRIPEDQVWIVLEKLLKNAVRETIRHKRHDLNAKQGRQPQPSAVWDAVRDDYNSGALDVMRLQVSVGGNWKFLGEITAREADIVADQYHEAEKNNAHYKLRYKKLAQAMREAGVTTADELPADRVVQIMSEKYDEEAR